MSLWIKNREAVDDVSAETGINIINIKLSSSFELKNMCIIGIIFRRF